jgi:putative hemolysin
VTVLAAGALRDATARYTLRIATDGADVHAAQRLRYQVFAEELGATLTSDPALPGHDVDPFDEHCDHLVVVEESTGAVVGTYRMLPPGRATAAGGWYSDHEFNLANLAPLRGALVETGRSCVHPDHRGGAVIGLMWAGLARYLHLTGHRWLAGCASIPLADGGGTADRVWQLASTRHLAPPRLRVTPHRPWPVATPQPAPGPVAVPPLLRGYLRLGAWVCGPPAHDLGYRYIETDIRATADGVAVVIHDNTLSRVFGHPGRIHDLRWADLQSLRVAGAAAVPRLDEVLGAWPQVRLNLDAKSDHAVAPMIAAVRRLGAEHRVLLASFSDARLARMRRIVGPQVASSLGARAVAGLWAAVPTGSRCTCGRSTTPPRCTPCSTWASTAS